MRYFKGVLIIGLFIQAYIFLIKGIEILSKYKTIINHSLISNSERVFLYLFSSTTILLFVILTSKIGVGKTPFISIETKKLNIFKFLLGMGVIGIAIVKLIALLPLLYLIGLIEFSPIFVTHLLLAITLVMYPIMVFMHNSK